MIMQRLLRSFFPLLWAGILFASLLTSCQSRIAGHQKTTVARKADSFQHGLELHLYNVGTQVLDRIVVQNESGGSWDFGPLEPGQHSPYQWVDRFCFCGYEVTVYGPGSDQALAQAICQHVQPCTEFLSGKARMVLRLLERSPQGGGSSAPRLEVEIQSEQQ